MASKRNITFFGPGNGKPGEFDYDMMDQAGQLAAEAGFRVVTGGYGGTGMEAPMRGAVRAEGDARGILLGYTDSEENAFCTEAVVIYDECEQTPTQRARAYCARLGELIAESDGFVANVSDQTPGTMVEVIAVINANLKFWKDCPRPFLILFTGLPVAPPLLVAGMQKQFDTDSFMRCWNDPQKGMEWLLERMK